MSESKVIDFLECARVDKQNHRKINEKARVYFIDTTLCLHADRPLTEHEKKNFFRKLSVMIEHEGQSKGIYELMDLWGDVREVDPKDMLDMIRH